MSREESSKKVIYIYEVSNSNSIEIMDTKIDYQVFKGVTLNKEDKIKDFLIDEDLQKMIVVTLYGVLMVIDINKETKLPALILKMSLEKKNG